MRLIFMGTPALAACALEKLIGSRHEVLAVVTQPDKASGRGLSTRFSPVKQTAADAGIPVLQPVRIREEEAISEIAAFQPELLVVAAYSQLLPEKLLNIAPYGCINIHPSLLPKYRGAAPFRGPILNGDAVSGVTIMKMVPALDAGDILLQKEIPLAPKETVRSLTPKASELGAEMLLEVIDRIEAGTAVAVPQDESQSSYISQLGKEAGRIDFQLPAEQIERQIRACDPWPSAFTTLGKKVFKIWDADVEALPEGEENIPGEVLFVNKKMLLVGSGEQCLKLNEVQMEGKKRMTIEEFLRGKKLEKGFKFGE